MCARLHCHLAHRNSISSILVVPMRGMFEEAVHRSMQHAINADRGDITECVLPSLLPASASYDAPPLHSWFRHRDICRGDVSGSNGIGRARTTAAATAAAATDTASSLGGLLTMEWHLQVFEQGLHLYHNIQQV